MLKTGEQHLDSLRDGRRVYIGDELVEDVTTHPAFRNAAQSFAMIYDRKRDPENIDVMAYEDEDGELSTSWYLKPKSKEDLRRRRETHRGNAAVAIRDSWFARWPIPPRGEACCWRWRGRLVHRQRAAAAADGRFSS